MAWGSGSWGSAPWGATLRGTLELSLPRLDVGELFSPNVRRVTDFTFRPQQGPFTGGTTVTFFGEPLNMTSCTPDFSTIDTGFWDRTGSVSPSSNGYGFFAGVSGGDVARLRTDDQVADVDVDVSGQLQELRVPFDAPVTVLELALRVNADTALRVRAEADRVQLVVTQNGVTFTDVPIAPSSGSPSIRLLRYGSFVVVFLGGTAATLVEWTDALSNIEVSVRNAAGVTSSTRTLLTRYVRRPVILFDGSPVIQLRQPSTNIAVGSSPPAKDGTPGPVDIQVTGCDTLRNTADDQFLYVLTDRPSVGFEPGQRQLLSLSDPFVTGRVGRSV